MSLDQGLSDVVHQVQGLQGQNSFLSKQNKLLKEQVIEQQSRYMRENLIFKRIPDTYDPNEDTEAKLKNFIATELEITENVEFHVVHRLIQNLIRVLGVLWPNLKGGRTEIKS